MKSTLNIQTGLGNQLVPKGKSPSPGNGKKRILTITSFFDSEKGHTVYQTQYEEIPIHNRIAGNQEMQEALNFPVEVGRHVPEPPSQEDLEGLLDKKQKPPKQGKFCCCF